METLSVTYLSDSNHGAITIQDPLLHPPIDTSLPLDQEFVPLKDITTEMVDTSINILCLAGRKYAEKIIHTQKQGSLTKQDLLCFDSDGRNIVLTLYV
jgi:hypothetical protein